ncbi:sensor histidine kinase [Psychrobacter sp. ANT_WB68]|uniref:sensor histidine kinase n=1 Tax=Psychrobacter sp. ANT_WB68 TaxID=2597355 RepID=UPI0011F0CCAC|nr:ATP-binding protein [Psychrobacter sp. ANT_WB68]KAA0914079.1 HAMP domain-containing protein [Psychrobacter sp. ANT_WB68]
MAKFQKLINSLQFQLMFWSVLSLLLLAIIAGGYGFWYSYNEINDFQDDNLKNTAALLEQSLNINGLNSTTILADNNKSASPNIHFDTDDDDGAITVDIVRIPVQPINLVKDYQNDNKSNGHDYSKPIPNELLADIPSGISDQEIDGHTWRTYRSDVSIKPSSTNEKFALILRQQTDLQDDLAKASALQSFLPLIIGIALLIFLLPFIMWRMMKPVRELHSEIRARNENDLNPLQIEHLPFELLPLAGSLNRLLALVKVSIERQQRFIADAAHEMRSPLTAISLQLQRLQRIAEDDVMIEGLDKLAIRLKRNQRLVEQLLTLARAGNIHHALGSDETESQVKLIVEQAIGLLIPIADHKNIELIVDLQSNSKVNIDATSLLMLIKNLIQNAIVYTPDNGQVIVKLFDFDQYKESFKSLTLSTQSNFGKHVIHSGKTNKPVNKINDRLVLQIIDSGTGIHPDDFAKVFEPFVRLNQPPKVIDGFLGDFADTGRSDRAGKKTAEIEGTGLGLSIVKSICEQAGIDVFMRAAALTDSGQNNGNKGLCVTLVF